MQNIRDVVYVRPEAFDRAQTVAMAGEVGQVNRKLLEGGRPRCGDETSGAGERRIDGWPPHGGRILSGEAA